MIPMMIDLSNQYQSCVQAGRHYFLVILENDLALLGCRMLAHSPIAALDGVSNIYGSRRKGGKMATSVLAARDVEIDVEG